MSEQAVFEKATNEQKALPLLTEKAKASQRQRHGFTRLMSISGFAMSLILPIGIVPRLMQSQELETSYQKTVHQLPQVSVAQVKSAGSEIALKLPGNIEAVLETPVYARANGYIDKRLVDIGDRVTAGQLLAHIETPEIDQSRIEAQAQVLSKVAEKAQSEANRDRAQADLDHARAELSQAQANLVERESEQKFAYSTYLRFKVLGQQGAVSIQDVEEKETRYKTTSAAKEAALDNIRAAQSDVLAAAAKLKAERANINVSDATIAAARAHEQRSQTESNFQNVVSPFAGVVTERNFDQGMLVTSGSESSKSPIYRIARIDTVKVFVDVPQYASKGVRAGQTVEIKLKEFPDRTFNGKVARTSVALDPVARTLRTEIHIDNSALTLAPGMYADVSFKVPRPSNLLLIPANALINRAEGPQVVTVASNHQIHFNKVQLGEDLGNEIEVKSGLSQNETVVVNPKDTLVDGTKVSEER
ncbi:MAG: efflux RND transporter periplasmic adaptor subunit [Candidatus Obscuribacterales bacterium]|nr:efflux RND transporter periplasmic adaptor subunit [Candidatus Obscuribacterales bacterium]